MIRLLLLLFTLFVLSCSEQVNKNESNYLVNTDTITKVINKPQDYTVQLFLFDSLKPKLGFGYNILIDGQTFIHQPSVPSVPGNIPFATADKATAVANLMIYKLKNNIMPPSISQKELDSLKILMP
jgi:hypothetical protein